ncbi:hypothetical protein TTHMIC_00016 [Tetrahymena thermophila SB210]|uniref:USP domain-containing protein n=1 Tax=Tetrahymena thermophila (strain SB210) TaxID=312017 RepID=A0A1B9C2F6_TETTS|nr:hypothetical protein TTHMIC_00016 [Tetrahymena thermophila SB210]
MLKNRVHHQGYKESQNNYSNKNNHFNSQKPLNDRTCKNRNEISQKKQVQNSKKSGINNHSIQNYGSTRSQYLPPLNTNQRNNEAQKQLELETIKQHKKQNETKKVHNISSNNNILTHKIGQENQISNNNKETKIESVNLKKNHKLVIPGNFIQKSSFQTFPLKNSQELKCNNQNAQDLIECNNELNEEIPNELNKNDLYKTKKPFNRKNLFQKKQNNQFKEIITSIQQQDKLFQIILNIINDEECHVSQQNIKDLLLYLRDPIYQFDQKPKDCRHLFSILIQKIRKQEVQINQIFKHSFLIQQIECKLCQNQYQQSTYNNPLWLQIVDSNSDIQNSIENFLFSYIDPNCFHQSKKNLRIKIQPSLLVISVEQIEKRSLVINQILKFQNQEDRVVQYKLLAVIFGPGHNYIQVNFNGKQYELNDSQAQQIDQLSSKGLVQLLCYSLVQ